MRSSMIDNAPVFVFWPCCKDLSLNVSGRIASGEGMHCVRCDSLEEARKVIEGDLRDQRDFMIIEGFEIKRWISESFPWEGGGICCRAHLG